MALPKNNRPRKSTKFHPVLIALVALIGCGALIATLSLLGVPIPFFGTASAGDPDRSGQIEVPVAARLIPAYTRVRRDHLIRPETMELASVWIDAAKAKKSGLISDGSRILNRVLAHDKEAAYAFSEDDFMPEGTRAGPTAGIEPGMRGIRVPVDRVKGMHGLKRGDRFDLVATQKLEEGKKPDRSTLVHPDVLAGQSRREAWNTSTRVLVQNGKVVEPVSSRTEAGARRQEVEEVLIAVGEHEAAGLTEAMAVEAEILCLPRSGLPNGGSTGLPQPAEPRAPRVIEVTAGDERWQVVVPDDEQPSASMEGR